MRAYVSIGSNVDAEHNVAKAIAALRKAFAGIEVSPVYRTAAVGFAGDDFLNLAVGFDTALSVEELDAKLDAIEAASGRDRDAPRFAPRTLDIDLLLFGDEIIERDGIRVPRRELMKYAFMLLPLVDIAADRRHPQEGRTFAELLAAGRKAGDFAGQRCDQLAAMPW